jgi:hypothetical protein
LIEIEADIQNANECIREEEKRQKRQRKGNEELKVKGR